MFDEKTLKSQANMMNSMSDEQLRAMSRQQGMACITQAWMSIRV
jgi:hypothetical protein